MRRFILLIIFVYFITPVFAQQDAQYSHYMFNPMGFNPGVAGMSDKICATVLRRDQWLGFDGNPRTTSMSVHMPVSPFGLESGVGLNIEDDRLGFFNDFKIRGAYSYHIPFLTGKIGLGLELGLYNRSFEYENWKTPDDNPSDNHLPKGDDKNVMAFDMAFGAIYKDEQKYLGFSVNHLSGSKLNYESQEKKVTSEMTRHYFITGGYNIATPVSLLELESSFLLKFDESSLSPQYELSAIGVYNKKFWGGVSYRYIDAVVALIGMEIFTGNDNGIRIGVAYDLTTSKMRNSSSNSTEVFLNYCFDLGMDKLPRRYKSIRYF